MTVSWKGVAVCACIVLLQTHCGPSGKNHLTTERQEMADDPITTLQTSKDPGELVTAAVGLARSDHADGHKAVGRSLASARFLDQLDSQQAYDHVRDDLRVARIMTALSGNKAPSARAVLVALTQDKTFLKEPSRAELLIEACAELRPPAPEVIKFWDRYTDPDDSYMNLVVTAVVHNGSTPALELFEKYMLDQAYERNTKVSWMRSDVMKHRNDAGLLQSCERLLMKGLPEQLNPDLVEVLFDFMGSWYRPSTAVTPPPREELTSRARAQLRRIGEYALKNVPLTGEQKRAVENTLEQLERRTSGPPGARK